jgi:hypothetical protein
LNVDIIHVPRAILLCGKNQNIRQIKKSAIVNETPS